MNRATFASLVGLAISLLCLSLSIHIMNEHIKELDTRVSALESKHPSGVVNVY